MKKNRTMFICTLVLVLSLNLANCQYYPSPCPNIFSYENDGYSVYGKIVISGGGSVSQLELQVEFMVSGQTTDGGSLDLENANYALQSYNQGYPMTYRVHFPQSSSLPKLTAITVNGNNICSGPGVQQQNQYISTFRLRHTSFLPRTSQQFNFVQRPQTHQNVWDNIEVQQMVYQDTSDHRTGDIFENLFNSWGNQQSSNRPSTPTYDEISKYFLSNENPQPNRFDETTQAPALPSRYQPHPTQAPVYEDPVTRPPRPTIPPRLPTTQKPHNQYDYINAERYTTQSTAPPEPSTTQRPAQRQPDLIECGTRATDNVKLPLIYNGNDYMRGEIPWLVALYKKKRGNLDYVCGGTLVSNRHVLTAAHCLWHGSERSAYSDIVVKIGVHNLRDWADDITVTRSLIDATLHDNYNSSSYENDIAVLTLNKRVDFNDYIRPACLWNGDIALERVVGASGLVAGWGDQSKLGGGAAEPQSIHLPIVKTSTCRSSTESFYDLTSDKTFCAGDRDGSGPCRGDSGSGLYLLHGGKWRLRGVVSVSLKSPEGSCNLDEYVVFTDTAQYLPWIRRVLQKDYFD